MGNGYLIKFNVIRNFFWIGDRSNKRYTVVAPHLVSNVPLDGSLKFIKRDQLQQHVDESEIAWIVEQASSEEELTQEVIKLREEVHQMNNTLQDLANTIKEALKKGNE